MIQAIQETNFTAFISTKENAIGTQGIARTRYLVKFINDLDGAVFYAYPVVSNIYSRYSSMPFHYNPVPNTYTGRLDLKPAGYFKYEVYEVSWKSEDVDVAYGTAPATETDVLPVLNENGVVEGLVAIGKLYLAEKAGEEEVQYTEYEAPSSTNYVYTGVSSPDIFNEYSLAFDGVDDILITTKDSSIMPTDNLTVGCWVNPTTWAFPGNAQSRYPFGCVYVGGWGLRFENNFNATITAFKGIIRVSDTGGGSAGYLESDAVSYSATLRALTGWHYIALTYEKATGVASIYLDGVEKATASGLAGADIVYNASNKKLIFGADALTDSTGESFFEGNIDEGSVWNKALTSAELLAVYNKGIPINLLSNTGAYVSSSNLQGWWRMGDPDGTTAYPTITDDSTNTNNGTMTNMVSADIETEVP